jgi:RimJ/RimL family protein N-acetyltransferase
MLELRPFTREDFPRLIRWIDSPRTLVQWGAWKFTFPLDDEQLTAYLHNTQGAYPIRVVWKAVLVERDAVVGHIELNNIDREQRTASVCRVFIAPDSRGYGLCTAMVSRATAMGFRVYGLRRIDLQVYAFNTRAIACYENGGFVKEGVPRKFRQVGEEYWDLVWMSILEEEWHECQASLRPGVPSQT